MSEMGRATWSGLDGRLVVRREKRTPMASLETVPARGARVQEPPPVEPVWDAARSKPSSETADS